MRTLMIALMLCIVSTMSFSQTPKVEGQQESVIVEICNDDCESKVVCPIDGRVWDYGTIEYNAEIGYILYGSTDKDEYCEKSMTSIYLGETKDDAIKTIDNLAMLIKDGQRGVAYYMQNEYLERKQKISINQYNELYAYNAVGKSNTAYCVAYFPDRFIRYIREFNELE
ncbi:MAG: hypothetical protein J5725_01950 [Bacteroidales bacterium]|nr:hypothetical protein [Bacteroidales bacterium]